LSSPAPVSLSEATALQRAVTTLRVNGAAGSSHGLFAGRLQSARGRETLEPKAGVEQGNTGYAMHTWEGAGDGMDVWEEAGGGFCPVSGLRSVGAGRGRLRLNEHRLSPLFNAEKEVFPQASSGVPGGETMAQNKSRS